MGGELSFLVEVTDSLQAIIIDNMNIRITYFISLITITSRLSQNEQQIKIMYKNIEWIDVGGVTCRLLTPLNIYIL
jgi:hypothetical protein